MDLKAILFDAGNTLVFIDPHVVLPVFRDHGAVVGERTFWEAEFEARTALAKRVEGGATGTEAQLWNQYFLDLFRGCGVPEESLDPLGSRVRQIHRERHLWTYVLPSTLPALGELRRQGYRLAVISNADGRMREVIRAGGLQGLVEFVVDSEEEGVEKPDPEIFLRACARLGLAPGACLYVGDLYPVDVLGAQGAGLQAVLLDPLDRLDYPVDRIPDVAALPDYLARLSTVG
ncbi:HAD family hydrolase [Gemmatimonadota bacterium]